VPIATSDELKIMSNRPGNADDLEQEARTALLELNVSLMQDYKVYILTLAIGSVGLAEIWHIVCPIFFLRMFCVAGAGFIVTGVFLCIVRFAYIGKLVVSSLCAAPSNSSRYAGTPLIFRLNRGILESTLDYDPHGITRKAWKLVAQLGTLSGNYLKATIILCASLFCVVSLSIWFLLSGYSCSCIS
jgi:hypothetical protein